MSFFENTREPVGLGGKVMVSMMNLGHRALADWGLQYLTVPANGCALDCGCGGGANLAKLLARCPDGTVKGIDYSAVSVEKSRRTNAKAIADGRCEVLQASVDALPFPDAQFDVVTAFETVYFWPGLERCFAEVYRVLRAGGTFFICNECSGDTDKDDKWPEMIDGMTIYKDVALQAALEEAGFTDVVVHKNDKGWLCLTGKK